MLQRKHKDIIPTYEQIVHQTFLLLHLYASGSFDSSKVMSYYNVFLNFLHPMYKIDDPLRYE